MTKKILSIIAAGVILYSTWLMILLSVPYLALERYTNFLKTKQIAWHVMHWRLSFYVHVFISTAVLITGLMQFSSYLLKRYPRLHRNMGKTYAFVVIAISGPTGLVMAFYANGGLYARISFVILSILWIGVTVIGWRKAMQRRWEEHSNWMLRSYALTLSAVTLRFYAYVLGLMHMPLRPVAAYVLISWLSWTLNLLIVEWYIRWKSRGEQLLAQR
ncbi:putative membrane protein DUF2306 [Chitinophaga dinghuensis]|uniref:Putative membrane protein DUF2306 n=1 Tax=Chitinophaga dinghuensis TaxID=1539050 RepID=A0A327W8J7_9BACT|nr:DUF2306 domain-containing protein [Chitinophaga dinghuensis]RAJ85562.1 putative membrane protein DUF2306 [Chitinophaga dinghuensis]